MSKLKDLSGKIFGKLKVLYLDKEKTQKTKKIYYICQCSCENKTIKSVRQDALVRGGVQSCGCLYKDNAIIKKSLKEKCLVENCNRLSDTKGYCKTHYEQMRVFGYIKNNGIIGKPPKQIEICKVDGCNLKVKAVGYCNKHYLQLYHYGTILKDSGKDPSKIIIYDTYAEIILKNKDLFEIGRAIIDLEDVEKCKNKRWGLNDKGYVKNGDFLWLARYVMNVHNTSKNKIEVDHIDGNPLNNQKSNLRICDRFSNAKNLPYISKNNTSGHKGVFYKKESNKWMAIIIVNNKRIHLGSFKNKEEAIKVRQEAELKYYGEYSSLNCRPQDQKYKIIE